MGDLPKHVADLVDLIATMGHLQLPKVEVDSPLIGRNATMGHRQLAKVEVNSSLVPCKV